VNRLPRNLAVAALLAGCAARPPVPPPPATPSSGRPDTVRVRVAAPTCPPPVRCPAPPDPRWHGIPAGADTALWVVLDSLVATDFTAGGGAMGACAMRVGDTAPLWSFSPDTRLLPASTQKVLTAAAALSELGPDFRWRTGLWMTGSVHDSVLHGDLVLEGGGDPTLGSADGNGLGGLVAAVQKAGIRRVHGNLVALDTLVGRGPDAWPAGWTVGSSKDGYGAPVVGLNWNQNRIGDHAVAEPRPLALKAFRKVLLARGIQVLGSDTTVRARGDSLGPRRALTRLGGVSSPELEGVMRMCLRESVNPYAEGMLLALGLGRRGPPREGGRKHLQEWLVSRGVDPSRLILDDGCGLSRYDLVTARQMARLLARDARSRDARLIDLLPRGGEGTLRHRIARFPDRSVLAAKTGTLDGVSNLAGYLIRPGRDTVAFAFLCGGYSGSPAPVRQMQDRLLSALAGLPFRMVLPADSLDTSRIDTARRPVAPAIASPSVRTVPQAPAAPAPRDSTPRVPTRATRPVQTDSVTAPPTPAADPFAPPLPGVSPAREAPPPGWEDGSDP